MDNIKYLILDFGKVIAGPTTGHWFITPKFMELIDMNEIDIDEFNNIVDDFNYILDRKILTEEEEFNAFYDFYDNMLKRINYSKYNTDVIRSIAHDMTYNSSKYTMYENVKEELELLSKQYILIMLTDNWPCVTRILKEYGIYDYFNKVYISSVYGCQKKDKVFFDYMINDYNIKEGEAIFVDDNESLLDIAKNKNLDTRLMVRNGEDIKSNHIVINDLYELVKNNVKKYN